MYEGKDHLQKVNRPQCAFTLKDNEIHIKIIIIVTNAIKICIKTNYLQKLNRPQCPFILRDSEIYIKIYIVNATKVCIKANYL